MGRTLENLILLPQPCHDEHELLMRLQPGGGIESLKYGYLSEGEDLESLIQEDARRLAELGLTHEDIAQAIEHMFVSDVTEVHGNTIIRKEHIHSPICPWGDYTTTSPFDYSMKNTEIFLLNRESCPEEVVRFLQGQRLVLEEYPLLVENDWAMIFSDLHPHLIREHKFFEGMQTPYRVDPERAARYLGLSVV